MFHNSRACVARLHDEGSSVHMETGNPSALAPSGSNTGNSSGGLEAGPSAAGKWEGNGNGNTG